MPRPLRLHVPDGTYYVTLRGNYDQPIFFRASDHDLLATVVADVVERCRARVHGYCWLPSDARFLIEVSDTPLSEIMQRLGSLYARAVHARLKTRGHLFNHRYRALLFDRERSLLPLLRYLHHKPVLTGAATTLHDYRWTSHGRYLGRYEEHWVTTTEVLALLDVESSDPRQAYARYVEQAVDMHALAPHPRDCRVLGDDAFLRKVLALSPVEQPRMTWEDLIAEACCRFSVPPEQFFGPSRARHLSAARAWCAHQVVKANITSISAVARLLGRNEASIRGLMRRHPDTSSSG